MEPRRLLRHLVVESAKELMPPNAQPYMKYRFIGVVLHCMVGTGHLSLAIIQQHGLETSAIPALMPWILDYFRLPRVPTTYQQATCQAQDQLQCKQYHQHVNALGCKQEEEEALIHPNGGGGQEGVQCEGPVTRAG